MADGSRPVPKHNHVTKEVKSLPEPQKPTPTPWQRKEKVKLSEEEKERRRQEMLHNASWRDKEREENVKRYRQEDDREKKQLHQNFDEDFARYVSILTFIDYVYFRPVVYISGVLLQKTILESSRTDIS